MANNNGFHIDMDVIYPKNLRSFCSFIICDIDGTLADPTQRAARHNVPWPVHNLDEFPESFTEEDIRKFLSPQEVLKDPITKNANEIKCYLFSLYENMITFYITCRPPYLKETTRKWLRRNHFPRFDLLIRDDTEENLNTSVDVKLHLICNKILKISGCYIDRLYLIDDDDNILNKIPDILYQQYPDINTIYTIDAKSDKIEVKLIPFYDEHYEYLKLINKNS